MWRYFKICFCFSLVIFSQNKIFAQSLTIAFQPTICSGSTSTASVVAFPSAAVFFNWSSVPAAESYSSILSGSSSMVTFSACGIHTIVCNAYDNSNNFLSSTSVTVDVVCATLSVVPISQTICPNGSATITASGASTYSWNTGSISSSVNVMPNQSSTYFVYGNGDICAARAKVAIFDITLTASSMSLCPANPVTLTAVGGGNISWLSPTNTVIASGVSTLVVTPTAVPVSYSLVATFGSACFTFKNISLDLYPMEVFAVVPASVCSGVSFSLQGYSATSFTWANTSQTSTVNPFITSQSVTNTYTLIADSANCRATKIFTIGISPQPTVTISSPQTTICGNQIANLYAAGAVNYTWTNHASMLSSLFGNSVMVAPFVNTTYTVLGANIHGCKSNAYHTVIVGTYPQISALLTRTSVCPGFTTGITANGANSFTWASTALGTPLYTPTIAVGAGTYSLFGSNGGGCRDSITVFIAQDPALNITANASASVTCIQKDGIINPVYFSASGAANYVWHPYVPGRMTFSLGPVTAVTPTSTTCYTVTGYTPDCSGKAVLCVQSEYCNLLSEAKRAHVYLYPNPVDDLLYIDLGNTNVVAWKIVDEKGVVIREASIVQNHSAFSINLEDLKPGLLFLQLTGEYGLIKVYKVLKR